MKLLIVSTAPFIFKNKETFAYSPYVNELIIYKNLCDEIIFCCPVWKNENGLLVDKIPFNYTKHFKLIDSDLITAKRAFKAFFQSFYNIFVIIKAMKEADHIHLRCPGNMALLGCLVQIFFPNKLKSSKYAGNWDPKSKQPLTYRIQKWILSNTFLTRNMQVLVYGEWQQTTKNIKPFFTASYYEKDKLPLQKKDLREVINFIFVGTLSPGKNPLYAVKLVENLFEKGYKVSLQLYGEGIERSTLENYILSNKLENYIILKGNQNQEIITKAYKNSHFVILPSKSEGWPKALAEGMFWGCVPIATNISCVPYMLNYGKRGILLQRKLTKDIQQLEEILNHEERFESFRKESSEWSRKYTLDFFESEIKKILKK
jgi:glycosyltransferase involved in cell wall biosynthesis